MTSDRHLILGTAIGYGWGEVAAFVRSLRRTGYGGDVVLFVGQLSSDDAGQFCAANVTLQPTHTVFHQWPAKLRRKACSRRLRRMHGMISWLAQQGERGADTAARAARYFQHVTCSRYDFYRGFLRKRKGAYSRVMISDVRDVLFQADPFSFVPQAPLEVFLEDSRFRLGNEPFNSSWLDTTYGPEVARALGDHRISCSGITMGSAAAMGRYLDAMAGELVTVLPRIAGAPFVDQAVHNRLLWTGAFSDVRAIENGQGAVFTMHALPESEIRLDATGRVIDAAGRIIPVLHQFDRHPAHTERLRALLA